MDLPKLTDQNIINWENIHNQLLEDLKTSNFINLFNRTEANLLEIDVQTNIHCHSTDKEKFRKITTYLYGHLELIEQGIIALKNAETYNQVSNEQFKLDLYDELTQIHERTIQVLNHIQNRYSDKKDLERFYLS